ncbi:mechanosensitive ion channel protein 10-like [Magnolia sinica]|uniref:mechanosensitive ion channel protein 10-like n=1 Tax=Magnolia sinica TaxID=86752 RepID=UPI00265A4D4F|nr:mechanosensitive ion channel protein 10-like [Magnolia sinica]
MVVMACLVSSLTIPSLGHRILWGLELWKWFLTVLVIFCGHLVSNLLVRLAVFLMEHIFMLPKKVLYFVYGLRRGVQMCVWLALVLLAWTLIFDPKVQVPRRSHKLLNKVTRTLIAILVGSIIWLVKIVLVKMLASWFHFSKYFDRLKESIFHQHILDTLSGEPLAELSRLPSQRKTMQRDGKIDMEQLRKLSRGSPSTWGVKRLMSHVKSTALFTTLKHPNKGTEGEGSKKEQRKISSEREARRAAKLIFKTVAKPGARYIEEDDLLKFLKKDEVRTIFPLFRGAETGKIGKSGLGNWVVNAYHERRVLAFSLKDTRALTQQIDRLVSALCITVIIAVFLLVTGIATTNVIFLITSQLLLMGFMFGNTCKAIFESMIFIFVQQPYDIGDRCVIDGIEMVVEEMKLLTTTFLRFDNKKIDYPNVVLFTKTISNVSRSPKMGETIEFSIDASTSEYTFNEMKMDIKIYIDSKPKRWQPKHSVVVKAIEDPNKMKIALHVVHAIYFQNFPERNSQRSDLFFELKKILERLCINYNLPPQENHLPQFTMATETTTTQG